LRAKDDFEIPFSPISARAICQLFQAFLIGEEFTGSSGPAARNSRRDQNYLTGSFVNESGRDCIIFDNLTPWSQRDDLPRP
jgi:hypothetical protein